MASLRQSSRTPSRASSLTRDPSPGRTGSAALGARARRNSLFDDDDFSLSKPFKKFSVDSSDFQPIKSADLRDRIRKISTDYNVSPSYEPKRNFQKSETTWRSEKNSLGQPVIKKEEYSFNLPETGKTFRRSSITDLSSYDSKPQITSFRSRRSSIGTNDDFAPTKSSLRTRKYSEESSSSAFGLPPRPIRHVSIEEPKFSNAQVIRDARKMKNSEELSDNIQKMVNKMRSHHLENAEADVRSLSRTIRSASLDPFEDDSPRSRSRQRARLNQFSYGVGGR